MTYQKSVGIFSSCANAVSLSGLEIAVAHAVPLIMEEAFFINSVVLLTKLASLSVQAIQQAPKQQVKGCLQGQELRRYYDSLIVKYFSDGQLQF